MMVAEGIMIDAKNVMTEEDDYQLEFLSRSPATHRKVSKENKPPRKLQNIDFSKNRII